MQRCQPHSTERVTFQVGLGDTDKNEYLDIVEDFLDNSNEAIFL